MKVTKSYLKQIIKEELHRINEEEPAQIMQAQQDPLASLNPVQKSNYQFIMKRPNAITAMASLISYRANEKEFQHQVLDLIKKIPQLTNFKLIKLVAYKSYGKVFKLSNRHILKIFAESRDEEDDMEWYKRSYNELHTGKANVRTLPVTDFAEIELDTGSKTWRNHPIYYVELAELIPLKKWIENTGRNTQYLDENFDFLVDAFIAYGVRTLKELVKYLNTLKQQNLADQLVSDLLVSYTKGGLVGITVFTKAEVIAIFKALGEIFKFSNLDDVYIRNIGLLPTSRPDKPVFVVFDI